MKWTWSAVSTTIAELPVKLVRYRMFGSDVTTSASSPRAAIAARTASCRRLSVRLGADDMDGVEEALERRDGQQGPLAKRIGTEVAWNLRPRTLQGGRRFLATSVPDSRHRRRSGDRSR